METSRKGEKKALFPLWVGQKFRGFVTIQMIFRCSSYSTVCYKAVITGQGTALSGSDSLFFFSQPLFLSENLLLLNTTSPHLRLLLLLLRPSFSPFWFTGKVYVTRCQQLPAGLCLSFSLNNNAFLSFNSIQLEHSWTTFYWQGATRWRVLLQTGQWLLNKEPLTM